MQEQYLYIFTAQRSTVSRRDPGDQLLNCDSCQAPLYVPAFEWLWVQTNEPVVLCDECRPVGIELAAVAVVPGAHEHVERTSGRAARRRMERDLHRWNSQIHASSN
jgi:hypothetical protein